MQKGNSSYTLLSTTFKSDTDTLVEKTDPIFKLRLDDSGEFKKNHWIKTPVLSSDVKVDLSPELCEETFKLFLLSGDRLSQMTRTYNDIDAVMLLLEEKERDLELAARIGQTLLKRNNEITEQKDRLEEKLANANEEACQLRYEVIQKKRLLLTYADEESDENSISVSDLQAHIKALHSKVQQLEQEKVVLANEKSSVEASHLYNSEREDKLLSVTIKQLSYLQSDLQSANTHIMDVTNELVKRSSEASKQQDEIEVLLSEVSQLQTKHNQMLNEHEELQTQLSSANNSQLELSQEVQHLESKYIEVLSMLDSTKQEMQHIQTSLSPKSDFSPMFDSKWQMPLENSLAAELKASSTNIDSSSVSTCTSLPHNSHAFGEDKFFDCSLSFSSTGLSKTEYDAMQTVRFVNNSKVSVAPTLPLSQSLPVSFKQTSVSRKPNWMINHSTPLLESPDLGQPGVPGTADLQRAIEKLTHVGKESLKFVQQTKHQLLLSGQSAQKLIKKCASTPKLRIVKPLEGSVTLNQWKNLADKSTEFPTTLSSPTSHSTSVITRGSIALSPQTFSKDNIVSSTPKCRVQPQVDRTDINGSYLSQSEAGNSGLLLSSSSTMALPLQSTNKVFNATKMKSKFESFKSVQTLPSLISAILPPATTPSVLHAVGSRSTLSLSTSSSVDLAHLHGSDHHNSSRGNF